ncbi:hypothetical protein HK098_005888 [Nowakowskiella sp. JEL0407]|nr:hypothetical protein HK098_005888 [Nowakowskiella sp. JEL0407]
MLFIDSTTLKATLSGTEPLSTYSDYISGLFLSNALLEIKSTIQYFSVLDAIQPSTETDIWNILSMIKKHFSTTIPCSKLNTHDFGLSFDLNPPVPQNLRDPEADTYCLLKLAKAKSVIRYQFGNEVVNVGAALILEFSKTIPVTMALESEIFSVPGVMRFDEFVRGSPTLNGNGVNHANHEINLDELMILNSTQNRFVDSLGTLAIEYKLRAEAVPAASINHIICLSVDAVSKVLEIIRRQVYFNSLFTVFNHSISEQTPNFFVEVTNWAPSTALTLILTPSIALNERFTPISVIANIEIEGDMIKAIVRSDDGREMARESEILSGFLQKTWDLSGVAIVMEITETKPLEHQKEPQLKTCDLYRTDPSLPERFQSPGSYNVVKQHPLYMTTSSRYGSQVPTIHDMPTKFYGQSAKFTEQLMGAGPWRNFSLNTK